MSDKKTPTNPPSTQDSPELEFDRFLRGEDTATTATYRKLPVAEPDAQLDARVRALARRALSDAAAAAAEGGSSGGGARADVRRTRSARWMPAFASAAVLVLAAGIVWQLGPRNWARKDAATDVALDATIASNATPGASDAVPGPAANAAPRAQRADTGAAAVAAKSSGALQPDTADEAKPALPFPTETGPAGSVPVEPPRPRSATPSVPRAAPAGSPQVEFRKEDVARDAAALADRPRTREPSAPAREKHASDAAASTELEKVSPGAPQASAPAATTTPWNLAARAEPTDRVANGGAALSPAPISAAPLAPAPPAPPPTVNAETTPTRSESVAQDATPARIASTTSQPASPLSTQAATAFPAAPAQETPPTDARRQDEITTTQQAPQRATAATTSHATGSAKARPAPVPAAPPPPPPMQAPASSSAFAPEPATAPDAAVSNPKTSAAAAASETEAKKQAYADHFALTPGSPPAKIPGRPTPAQVAAWPEPNCHAAGTVSSGRAGNDARTWSYPPEVPDSEQLRFVIVKNFLEAESPEAARKAYADFRQCHPEDRWPASLLRRLGVQ